ncbi:hypothetical protein ACBY01_04600 [Sphingomonas sp. ac-8]|uniref:hypothetical protein n=1 Tax=Sphingomonas sp. ac-8 TaxID=3242977 RepID=UPI003A809B35
MLAGLVALAASATATPAPLTLAGPAGPAARTAVLAEAKRQQMTEVAVAAAQSFRVLDGGSTAATLLTGEGNMPGTTFAGCFVATVQGDDTMLIPTLGYGNYEAETCGGPLAVGILLSGATTRIGVIFKSYSRDAVERVPIVIDWDRSNNTLLIDEEASSRALDSGAKTIPALRRLVS